MAELKHVVRIKETDIRGEKNLVYGITRIKGVGHMFAHAVCTVAKMDPSKKVGALSQQEVEKIAKVIDAPLEVGIPSWLVNRRKERETGEDTHRVGTKLMLRIQDDVKEMKRIKCYRGMRHMFGLPCRGQRTKNNFRPNRGKGSLGVTSKGKGDKKK